VSSAAGGSEDTREGSPKMGLGAVDFVERRASDGDMSTVLRESGWIRGRVSDALRDKVIGASLVIRITLQPKIAS